MNRLLLLILGLSISTMSFGQKTKTASWKAYKKKAEELVDLRQYAKAGAMYEKAHSLKPERADLLVKAADKYMLERDFANAARIYSSVVDNPKYKSSKLNYAYSLKQSNQFEMAMLEFASCLDNLAGKNEKKEAQINKEIMGCQFALEQLEGFVVKPYGIDIAQLTTNINTRKSQFAPYHVSDTKLYYSTLDGGNANIKSSEWRDGKWSEGIPVKGLKGLKGKNLCNAIVSPDESEMFFTVCNDEQVWGGLSSRCDIYVSKNKGKSWGAAKKLNANVNHNGSTNTQPFILEKNGEQQIYFASNRSGGQGGMDLWFASRSLEDENSEFGQAINLGPNVNTIENEITPFYNSKEGVLYFSSDGHLTMGGFDVFKTVGDRVKWSVAENIGMPINTGADEKYYTIAKNSAEGYFVSNRAFGEHKLTSTDEDIFTFNVLAPHFFVEGTVADQQDLSWLDEAQVYLYELKESTEDRRLLSTKVVVEGKYDFRLLPNRNYQLSFEADGYAPNISYLNTNDENLFLQERNVTLFSDDAQPAAVASLNEVMPIDVPVKKEAEIAETTEISESTVVADVEVLSERPVVNVESEFTQRVETQMEEMTSRMEEGLVIGSNEENIETSAKMESLVIGASEESIITEIAKEKAIIDVSEVAVVETVKETLVIGAKEDAVIAEVRESLVIGGTEGKESLVIGDTEVIAAKSNTNVVNATIAKTIEVEVAQVTAAELYIASTIAAENSNLSNNYATTESKNYANFNNSFVSKGNAKVPSGTGIYTYDENRNEYEKEASDVISEPYTTKTKNIVINTTAVSEPYTIPDPVYSNSTSSGSTYIASTYETTNTVSAPMTKNEAPTSNLLVGTTYKVQLIAVEYHNPSHRRYEGIKNLGLTLNTEYIEGKGWTRVLLGAFKSEGEARKVLDNARSNGFKRAYVVSYQDGQRKKRLK